MEVVTAPSDEPVAVSYSCVVIIRTEEAGSNTIEMTKGSPS